MITAQQISCPSCGASLDAIDGRTEMYCAYCGSRIILRDDNEIVTRVIDEAEVIRAQTERDVARHNIEVEKLLFSPENQSRRQQHIRLLEILKVIFILGTVVSFVVDFRDSSSLFWGAVMVVSAAGWIVTNFKLKERTDEFLRVVSPSDAQIYSSPAFLAQVSDRIKMWRRIKFTFIFLTFASFLVEYYAETEILIYIWALSVFGWLVSAMKGRQKAVFYKVSVQSQMSPEQRKKDRICNVFEIVFAACFALGVIFINIVPYYLDDIPFMMLILGAVGWFVSASVRSRNERR